MATEMEQVRGVIEAELGLPVDALFSTFDDEPLGAASIGQAHAATLRESGQSVVVKVQFPDAKKYFVMDMATIKAFCRLASPENVALMDEIGARARARTSPTLCRRAHAACVHVWATQSASS